ncbi:hypothetical protein [Rhizobium sp. SGZ-381]|uniref:hypothetical protein n=1 Tax=Rhizobium sp. SGZ-381 TaxID=3342800 RepID=UPI00366FB23B
MNVLEHDGEKINAFRTYFDTRHLPSPYAGRADVAEGQGSATSSPEDSDLDRAQREAAEQRAAGGYA